MLLLAVFCGLLVEYQLEHKIEKEKQFIVSLITDLEDVVKTLDKRAKELMGYLKEKEKYHLSADRRTPLEK